VGGGFGGGIGGGLGTGVDGGMGGGAGGGLGAGAGVANAKWKGTGKHHGGGGSGISYELTGAPLWHCWLCPRCCLHD
jgi:hypothetical protein